MNSDRPESNLKQALAQRAHEAKGLAAATGRRAFLLPYPYDQTGLEHFEMITKEEYINLLELIGYPTTGTTEQGEIILTY